MIVYVVAACFPYEGWGQPDGVYSTRQRAEDAIKREKVLFRDDYRIVELELDKLDLSLI